ncbi:lysine-rich nucleolar protein 1 isoform X1 [Hippoglossus stenolepis]|uniref:lysine-rich nucleolar protein 1 isoform X1 n=2 Tax=Hippoglossus stenolepis TaxID=195615 RepID=UPI001FAFCDC4|nr:lysine-rich nucleolar protein 1 isoform X1 [Hippoglossus stenolepis]
MHRCSRAQLRNLFSRARVLLQIPGSLLRVTTEGKKLLPGQESPRVSTKSHRSVAVERQMEMMIEDDRSEGNLVKKKKKQKKGQASVPENKNCTVDDGSPTEVKKERKKSKKVETVVIEDESRDEGDERKNKKRKNVNDSLNDAGGSDAIETAKEGVKKKNQQQVDDINNVEIAQSSGKEEMEKKERKEKKVKNNTVQSQAENVKIQEEKEEQQAGKEEEPKKAKKRKNNILSVNTEVTEEQSKRKKKKTSEEETTVAIDEVTTTKKKAEVGENELKLETAAGGTEGEEVMVKKKNKNKAENGVVTPEIKRSKAKKTETDSMLDESGILLEEEKTEQKKKGKGRKASVEVTEVEDTEPKKKKRKKGSSKGEEEWPLIKCEENEEAGDTTSKKVKKKKSSAEVTQTEKDVGVETGAKKKKKKKIEEASPQMDMVFLSEKSGNTDEININQERRPVMQKEIDKASQPEKPAKPSGLGQWSTARFDSSDQQQKFLRLMGGFKKGFQPAAASTGGANLAMGQDAQQQLQQGLLGEFERAHTRRMDFSNKGAGLGFSAPSNKKFSIDINTSRSIRFDD